MRSAVLLLILSFFGWGAVAADTTTIRLHVVSPDGQPVASATVSLRRMPDSVLVKVQMTDAGGAVVFAGLQRGAYVCQVSHAAFAAVNTALSAGANDAAAAVPIVLTPASGEMAGLTVTARRPFVELKPGKTVINVEAGITNAGATALEALETMPGITVDRDGNISLKGRGGVLVLIDGRQTYLDPAQLATLLGGLNASQLAQVEIMDQPSAAYDAAGNAGVINIKLKKTRQRGFNGSLTASYGQGFYPKKNSSLQLNYRSGKWNVFANYAINHNTNFMRVYALRTYFEDGGAVASLLEQPSFIRNTSFLQNLRTGVDYSLSTKTSVAFTVSGIGLQRESANTNRASWLNALRTTDSLIITRGESTTTWENAGANLNLKHQFSANRELTADVDLLGYRIGWRQFFENRQTFPAAYSEGIRASLPANLQILSAKTDYVQQWKTLRMETGAKISKISTDNLAAYEVNENGRWQPDWGRSNHFLYDENIQAVYANAEAKDARWRWQAGLRFEATQYTANQLGNPVQKDSLFTRRYSSLFPSVLASFEADSNHQFSVSAGRRIDRPAFQKLNPFIFIINKYTVQQGNPFFRPQFTWNMEVSHAYKQRLMTSIGYSITDDFFSQIFPQDNSGVVIYTEGNLGRLQQWSLSVSTQLSPLSWWSFNTTAVAVHRNMNGVIGTQLHASITQLTFNMNHQLRFKKGWSGEVTGLFTSRSRNDIQEIVDPAGQLSFGVAKSLLQNRCTVKLAVRDVFYTQRMKGNTFFPQAHEYFKVTRDTRLAMLSVSYRFGQSFKTSKRSEGAAGEEVRRVGNG